MKRFKNILVKIRRCRALKYVAVAVLGVIIVGVADDNSVWSHYSNKRKIAELQDEIRKYRSQYEHDQAQLKLLDGNSKAIEKIARERYYMKTDDEDIFVLSDDERQPQQQADETTE